MNVLKSPKDDALYAMHMFNKIPNIVESVI